MEKFIEGQIETISMMSSDPLISEAVGAIKEYIAMQNHKINILETANRHMEQVIENLCDKINEFYEEKD